MRHNPSVGDGTTDDTAAFDAAIAAAAVAGGVVFVPEGTYRIEGTLRVTTSGVVLARRGAGAHVRSSGIRLTAVKRTTVADCTVEAAQNRGPGRSARPAAR